LHPCRREYAYPPRLLPLAILTLAVAAAAPACQESPPQVPVPDPQAAVGTPEGRFVGSASCRSCHADAFHAWASGRHPHPLRGAAGDGRLKAP